MYSAANRNRLCRWARPISRRRCFFSPLSTRRLRVVQWPDKGEREAKGDAATSHGAILSESWPVLSHFGLDDMQVFLTTATSPRYIGDRCGANWDPPPRLVRHQDQFLPKRESSTVGPVTGQGADTSQRHLLQPADEFATFAACFGCFKTVCSCSETWSASSTNCPPWPVTFSE